ncbi:MAG TPA: D-alanyl-D-alanine carboxypeptidase family protein [Candidatus Binataceae bacterium]|nr:D-alanyl-D-alanine carboxypeptidase family protein [Candidatus Binataceae bacterium]
MRVLFRLSFRLFGCLCLAATIAGPDALAAPPHHVRSAKMPTAPPIVPLSQIRAFDSLPAPFALEAKSALMIDEHTGTELYAFNEHEKMQPASLAKIMTFYLTLEALHQNRIALDTQVNISEDAWRLSLNDTVSRMFLQVGQKVAVRDLLYGLMVSSGNDAAVALAEYLGGSSDAFAQQMNDKAKQLGLNETHFTNPDGLPTEGEYTTAADMVKLGRDLQSRFPDSINYTSAKDYTWAAVGPEGKVKNITQRNFDTLLFYDSHADGIKTGHVDEAGYHLVGSGHDGDMRLLSAVMGTVSMEKRRVETKQLFDWGFRTFNTVHPDWHKTVPASLPVYQGTAETVAIAPATETYFTCLRGKENQVTTSYIGNAKYLIAPIAKGAVVGSMAVMQEGKQLAAIPVVAQTAVPRAGIFKRLKDKIRLML